MVANVLTGLRYERDLTNLTAGAYPGYVLSQIQNMLMTMTSKNNENTDTTEFRATQSAYRLLIAPLAMAAVSAMPGGSIPAALGKGALLMGASSNDTASAFAGNFYDKPKPR